MKRTLLGILVSLSCVAQPSIVSAQELSSPNYKLQFGDFTVTSGSKSSEQYNLQDTVGQQATSVYGDSGYILKAGFQYLTEHKAFRFTIEPNAVRFSSLYPDQPQTIDVTLSVSLSQGQGYQILAGASDALKSSQGHGIPDARCDDPVRPCSPTQATPWINALMHGFGFTVVGGDGQPDFLDGQAYRPFLNLSGGGQAVPIIASSQSGTRKNQLKLKIVTGEDQPSGIYQNTIQFTAIPNY